LEFNSAIIRYLLSFFYRPGNIYRIPFGSLRGLKLGYDRTINFHAILGLWEQDNFTLSNKILTNLLLEKNKLVIYDIGANIGLFSLFFSKRKNADIFAFEAVPDTVEILKRNLALNATNNVTVLDKAVSDTNEGASFFVGHHHKSSLVKDWASDRGTSNVQEIHVPSVKLDSFVEASNNAMPDFIKIDVEGGGNRVIEGLQNILKINRPVLLFESHTAEEDEAVIGLLDSFNYRAFRVNNRKWVTNQKTNYKDPNGVWGTMFLVPQEKSLTFD